MSLDRGRHRPAKPADSFSYDGPLFDGHVHAAGPFSRADRLVAALDRGAWGRPVDRAVLLACPVPGTWARYVPAVWHRTVGTWALGKRLNWSLIGVGRAGRIPPDNELVARLVAAAPARLVGYAFVDPRVDDPLQLARYWVEARGFGGLKLHLWIHRARLLSDGVQQLAGYAARRRLPLLLHPGLEPDCAGALEALAALHPDAAFIVAHLNEEAVDVAARRDNVFLDTSGLCMAPRHLQQALGRAGAGKLIFGSDSPAETGGDLSYSLRLLAQANLPERDLDRICWGNLSALLSEPHPPPQAVEPRIGAA
jgi:uncharacterized protein